VPWEAGHGSVTNWPLGAEQPDDLVEFVSNCDDPRNWPYDARLIAATRTALPALLDALDAAVAALKTIRALAHRDDADPASALPGKLAAIAVQARAALAREGEDRNG
jgi:hypothetical protein